MVFLEIDDGKSVLSRIEKNNKKISEFKFNSEVYFEIPYCIYSIIISHPRLKPNFGRSKNKSRGIYLLPFAFRSEILLVSMVKDRETSR